MNQINHEVLKDILNLLVKSHTGKQGGAVTAAYPGLRKLQLMHLVGVGFHRNKAI